MKERYKDPELKRVNKPKVSLNDEEMAMVVKLAATHNKKVGIYLREVALNPQNFIETQKVNKKEDTAHTEKINKRTFMEKLTVIFKETYSSIKGRESIILTEGKDVIEFQGDDFILTYRKKK
jgi:hypothetical protein